MKNKNKKLVSRIICGILVPLFLFLNAGASLVAYAAPKTPATPATPPTTCPSPFTESKSGDCTKKGYKEGDKCPDEAKYHINKTDSILDSGTPVVEGILYCSPNASIAPVDAKVIANGIAIIAGIQRGLNRLIWPVLVLTGGLMGNDLLFGNGMEEKLRDVWIPIRNLVNILFVIVLVGLALYNVLGLADDNTSIKSMLPKIVIGIIAVNFSFLAIKVVLDGINVMTTAVFSLPGQVSSGLADVRSNIDEPRLCAALEGTPFSRFEDMGDDLLTQQRDKATYQKVGKTFPESEVGDGDSIDQVNSKMKVLSDKKDAAAGGTATPGAIMADFKKKVEAAKNAPLCDAKKLNAQGKLFLARYNSRNAAFALALNMGKIVFYNDIDTKSLGDGADALEKIFTNSLFSMVLYVIYCVSFIALFIVLLGRLVVMWLSIAVSPILLLMIASPQVKEKMGGFSKLSEQFTKNAIAPLLIALSMTVGWIMLKAVQGLELSTSTDGSLLNINPSNGIPVASMNTLQDVIVALGVIAVVWMGVFSAADGTIAEGATKWIKGAVEKAGSFVGQIPFKHLPLIPIALPDHPHDHYTFSQLGNFIEGIGNSNKDVDKLSRNAGVEKTASPDNLKDMRDEGSVRSWLNNLKTKGANDLHDIKYKDKISDWLSKNPDAKRELGKTKDGKTILRNLEILATSTKETERKKAAAAINETDAVKQAKTELEPQKAATAPAAAATTPKGGKPAADTSEDFFRKKGADGKPDPKDKTEGDGRIKDMKASKEAIMKAPAGEPDDSKVKAEVEKIKKNIATGKMPTDVDGRKALFGDAYDRVVKAYGGDTYLAAALAPKPAAPVAKATTAAESVKVQVAANVNTTVTPQQGAPVGDNASVASAKPIDIKSGTPGQASDQPPKPPDNPVV